METIFLYGYTVSYSEQSTLIPGSEAEEEYDRWSHGSPQPFLFAFFSIYLKNNISILLLYLY